MTTHCTDMCLGEMKVDQLIFSQTQLEICFQIYRKVHDSQANVRFETNVSTTTVELVCSAIAKQAIVADESERNVD